jgi:hypothetical protein
MQINTLHPDYLVDTICLILVCCVVSDQGLCFFCFGEKFAEKDYIAAPVQKLEKDSFHIVE